jgi:pseudouridine synthase
VTVDGRVARVLGTRVNPDRARIEVDGRRIAVRPGHDYYVLNKPPGYVTTVSDPRGRPTVMDLVRSRRRIFPIGRLDADTAGVLLLTDDGELAHRLAHPRFQVPRVYVAEVIGLPGKAVRERLEKGVRLQDGLARAQRVRVRARGSRSSQVEVTMAEGRKHEVRLMLEAVGHPVTRLARISYGPIRLAGLPLGAVRALTPREVGDLQVLVGL